MPTPATIYNTAVPSYANPYQGVMRIAYAAYNLAQQYGRQYAYNAAPTSMYANLSGNRVPGVTPLNWLLNQNKCNQFVGEALTRAGYRMPTFRMADGSEHFMNAEALPNQSRYFARVSSLYGIEQGDVLVIDYKGSHGSNGAHTEVITGGYFYPNGKLGALQTAGAHRDGAYLKDYAKLFNSAQFNPTLRGWTTPSATLYVLRPLMGLGN